jgi:hypothetical protein
VSRRRVSDAVKDLEAMVMRGVLGIETVSSVSQDTVRVAVRT